MCARRVHQHPAYIPRITHSRDQALIMKRNMPLRASLAPWLSELFLEPKWASTSERARGLRARAYARPGPTFNSGTNISCLMAPCLSTLRLRTYVRTLRRTYVRRWTLRPYVRTVSRLRRTYVRAVAPGFVLATYVRTYDCARFRACATLRTMYVRTYARTHVRTRIYGHVRTYPYLRGLLDHSQPA